MYERELKIAIAAVKASEKTFRKYFGTKTKVEIKNGDPNDLASYADRKIESDIEKYLIKHSPTYGFHGEETGKSKSKNKFVWVLDPVDGTGNYLRGDPNCAISLALLKNDVPVLGVVYAPMLNYIYTAAKGQGAAKNGKQIHVSKTEELRYSVGALGWGHEVASLAKKIFNKVVANGLKVRVPGCGSLNLSRVAEGVYNFTIDGEMKIWDYAAGQIIIEEAGGMFINSKSPRIQIAANKTLAAKLFKIFK